MKTHSVLLWLTVIVVTVTCLFSPRPAWADTSPRVLFLVAKDESPREQATRRALTALFSGEEASQVEVVPRTIPELRDDQVLIARGLIVERGVDGVFWMTGPDENGRHTLLFVGANNEHPIERDITHENAETTGVSAALVTRWAVDALAQGRAVDHLEETDAAAVGAAGPTDDGDAPADGDGAADDEPADDATEKTDDGASSRRRPEEQAGGAVPSPDPDRELIVIDEAGPKPLDFSPRPYGATGGRRSKERDFRVELIATPGVGLFTGDRSEFSEPSFHLGFALGLRMPFSSVSFRGDVSPVDVAGSDNGLTYFSFGGALQAHPLNEGVVDIGFGLHLAYAKLSGRDGPTAARAEFFAVGPTTSLLFRIPLDERKGNALLLGPRATWLHLETLKTCVGSTCNVRNVNDGHLDVGLTLGYSGGI